MRSDNGTNFVGAERELFRSIDKEKVQSSMTSEKIDWRFNPPGASHMGGIWERVIRSIRSTLTSLMRNHGTRLDDEGLRTLMTEVEAIVNSRPLTTVSSDVDDLQALTPAHLLTMKPSALMAPSGEFVSADIYARKRWRRVQYMTNLFWTRWQREYLVTLQSRQKWTGQRKNLQIGDVVLIKDENTPRNSWALGRVKETEPDRHGTVRTVTVQTKSSELRRPVAKLVLILAKDEHPAR